MHRNKLLIKTHLSVISHHLQLVPSLSHPPSQRDSIWNKMNEMNSWRATMTKLNEQMSPIGSSVTRTQSRSRRILHDHRGIHPMETSQLADITRGVWFTICCRLYSHGRHPHCDLHCLYSSAIRSLLWSVRVVLARRSIIWSTSDQTNLCDWLLLSAIE